jgi:superfamily II DNA or RNA helicase
MSYPWYNDPSFVKKLLSKQEFYENRSDDSKCLKYYQRLAANYINPKNQYQSLLLYMNVGTGKTLASIAIAENFIKYTDMKITIITKNEDLVNNYITELLTVCSNYTTPKEIQEFREAKPSEKLYMIKQWYPRIKKYNFRHHEEFKKSFLSGNIQNLSNRVIIIDEAHKMIGNKGYEVLFKLLSASVNYRLVLLSATPVFDNIIDIFQLSNLFQVKIKKNILPIDETLLIKGGYIKRMTDIENISIFKDDKSIFSLTQKGLDTIKNLMKYHVLYMKSSPDDFPKLVEIGERVSVDNYRSEFNIVKCKMHPYQESRYLKLYAALKSSKDFNRNLEHASNMIYPDYKDNIYIGNAGYDLYVNVLRDSRIFKETEIGKYSSKLYHLLQMVKKSVGKICIYSSYINDDGLAIIQQMLKANGISKYMTLTGKITAQTRKAQIERFNNPQNDDGSDVKILLFSAVLAEGITLKSVREIHIFEPAWNMSSLDQVIGRVYRTNSHARLPKQDRVIKIFKYCSLTTDYKLSSDLSKYIKAGRKDYFIKTLERILIKSSFLCSFTKQTNLRYSGQYKDGDRECEYSDCNYSCDYEPQISTVDSSTYDTPYHNPLLYNSIKTKAIQFFEKNNHSSLDNMIKLTGVKKEELVSSMRMLIKNRTLDLKTKDNYYIKVSAGKKQPPVKETLKNRKIRMEASEKIFIGNSKGKLCSSYKKDEIINLFALAGLPKPDSRLTKDILCKSLYKELMNLKE